MLEKVGGSGPSGGHDYNDHAPTTMKPKTSVEFILKVNRKKAKKVEFVY